MRAFFLFLLAYILAIVFTIPIFIIKLISLRNIDYVWTCAIGIDQMGGSILYNEQDFTISSYTYWLCQKGNERACKFEKVIDFFFGTGHCARSYYWEINHDKKELNERSKV